MHDAGDEVTEMTVHDVCDYVDVCRRVCVCAIEVRHARASRQPEEASVQDSRQPVGKKISACIGNGAFHH